MAISAKDVMELRKQTDCGMMECKKALTEADGNFEKAIEILRERGLATAAKKASRVAAEGMVYADYCPECKVGVVIEVNAETDFVAKNPEFMQMAKDAVRLVAEKNPADLEALAACELNGTTLEAVRTGLVGKIGENMTFRRFARVEAKGELASYVHGSKIGVLVDMVGGTQEVAHDIAMHIAASKPKALDESGVAAEAIESERRIAIEKAREAGKPEAMLERIAEGSVKKFLKEVTLVNQPFVKNDKKSVGELLKSAGATVAAYQLYIVGEGIEKRQDDFAAEVAAQVAAAKNA